MSTLFAELWGKQLAADALASNQLFDLMKKERDAFIGPQQVFKVDPYAEEKKILRRLNRCKTRMGKLKALAAILSDVRDEADY